MQIIDSYKNIEVGWLHQTRLFYLTRPLLVNRKNPTECTLWDEIKEANDRSANGICFIDSAGWIFPIESVVVESTAMSKKWCQRAKIFDYAKRSISHPLVYAYCPNLLRYCDLKSFEHFVRIWTSKEMILYFDKRLVMHNYLKFDLRDLIDVDLSIEETRINQSIVRWHILKLT